MRGSLLACQRTGAAGRTAPAATALRGEKRAALDESEAVFSRTGRRYGKRRGLPRTFLGSLGFIRFLLIATLAMVMFMAFFSFFILAMHCTTVSGHTLTWDPSGRDGPGQGSLGRRKAVDIRCKRVGVKVVWWRRRRAPAPAVSAAALAALVGGTALTGCSGTGAAAQDPATPAAAARHTPRDAREVIRRSADMLAASGSSRARTAMEMISGGTRITIHGEGGFDYAQRRGRLLVTLPADRGAGHPGPVTEVFSPGVLYMKNRGAGVPAGQWIEIDVTTLRDGNLVTGGATDPLTAAALLRGVRTATDLGKAEVDGEMLRHVRGVTDIAAAAQAAAGLAREQLTAAVGGFTDTMVPFDAYVDDRGLLRKVRQSFSFAGNGGARQRETVDVTSTVVLHGFGAPVDIALPGPAEIYSGAVVVADGR